MKKKRHHHEEEVLALDKKESQSEMGSYKLSAPVFQETEVPKSVVLTARKGRENSQIDAETGLPGSCIGIPFRVGREGKLEILLIKKSSGDWRFPGGTWETDESKEQCVLRECLEEGGLRGVVVHTLEPTFHMSRKLNKINKRYFWFLVEIKEYFSRAAEDRQRQFFDFHKVMDNLSKKEMKDSWVAATNWLKEWHSNSVSKNAAPNDSLKHNSTEHSQVFTDLKTL